jgi:hypothetical protein
VKLGTQPEENELDFEDSCHEGTVDLKHLKNLYDAASGSRQ